MATMKKEIEEILTLVKGLQKDIKGLKTQQAIFTETIANIHQVSEDLSRKFDEMVNVTGIKNPVTKKSDDEEKTKSKPKTQTTSKAVKTKTNEKKKKLYSNIMTYFRAKYLEDQTYFHSIMDEDETKELFDENKEDLKAKKGDKKLKAQVGFLYKSINKNKIKITALRAMMDKENTDHDRAQGTTAEKDSGSDSDSDSDPGE